MVNFDDDPGEEWEMPPYDKPGRVLVTLEPPTGTVYRWDYDVLEWDTDGGAFWVNEGEGWEHWLDSVNFPGPGTYLVTGIKGTYHRGNWSYGEDDSVDWEHDDPVLTELTHLP